MPHVVQLGFYTAAIQNQKQIMMSGEELVEQVRLSFDGEVAYGRDLDVF